MRLSPLWLLVQSLAVIAGPSPTAPYRPAASLLVKRQAGCPANTYLCSSSLGAAFSGICCQQGQVCALDNGNNPACCPAGAVCTGNAPAGAPTPAVSFVPNTFFPFPYIPTSFANSGACSSAVSQCSQNYDSCLTQLQGGNGFGVTVIVPGGGGTTVAATQVNIGAAATPVCSSLSSAACFDLQTTQCARGTAANGVVVGAAARQTTACMAGIVAGVGVAVFGALP